MKNVEIGSGKRLVKAAQTASAIADDLRAAVLLASMGYTDTMGALVASVERRLEGLRDWEATHDDVVASRELRDPEIARGFVKRGCR